mgnify:CR=1 FL=1
MYKVVITEFTFDNIEQEKKVLEPLGAQVVFANCKTEADFIAACRDADAVIHHKGPVSRKVIEEMQKCRFIGGYGAGFDTVDVKAATERGIPVANTPGYCKEEVSDHALALIYAMGRKLIWSHVAAVSGLKTWNPRPFRPMHRLLGQTVGLIGFGNIARTLAAKLKALNFVVLATDPYIPDALFQKLGVERVTLDELLERSDFISLHTVLDEVTFHMISTPQLQRMKRSAYIINTCRGQVIDQEALTQALEKNVIAGAALDVLEDEPPTDATRQRLFKLPNVIILPHTAWYSEEAMVDRQRMAAETVAIHLQGGRPDCVVNTEVYERRKAKKGV